MTDGDGDAGGVGGGGGGGGGGGERSPSPTPPERDAAYASSGSPLGGAVPGLFSSLSSAASVLRIARSLGELDPSVASDPGALDSFMDLLDDAELSLRAETRGGGGGAFPPFVVAVEGLDGSGKSTLVRRLAASGVGYREASTPPRSLDPVRPVFDKRGGAVARAFYMASNYVLQREMRSECEERRRSLVYVVDRFYGTTCAYTVGWGNTSGSAASVGALDGGVFDWPSRDLDPPRLMLLLDVKDSTRRERVRSRARTSDYNPWDGRLSSDPELGDRIMAAYRRVADGAARWTETVVVDAGAAPDAVHERASRVVLDRSRRALAPWEYYDRDPVGYFVETSRRLGLCDDSGRRGRRAPWAAQLALSGRAAPDAPSLRTVGVHTADGAGFLFFVRGHPGGGYGGDPTFASVCWVGGEYPREEQWRAEGALIPATPGECELMGTEPPGSLVAQMCACAMEEAEAEAAAATGRGGERLDAPPGHNDLVTRLRGDDGGASAGGGGDGGTALPVRLAPMRLEVLIGGPSSPGGPRRYEWRRAADNPGDGDGDGWGRARPILPFTAPGSIPGAVAGRHVVPVTLAVTGTHCSGKGTVGERVARALGWDLDPELGDVMRDGEALVDDGHRSGDGSGGGGDGDGDCDCDSADWDGRVFAAEVARDRERERGGRDGSPPRCRVVETWHVGNLAWALQRGDGDGGGRGRSPEARTALVDGALGAVRDAVVHQSILFVHLNATAETSVRRRRLCGDGTNASRLPMSDEVAECARLSRALGGGVMDVLGLDEAGDLNVPLLVLDNNVDGDDAVDNAARRVVRFVNRHHWRRVR